MRGLRFAHTRAAAAGLLLVALGGASCGDGPADDGSAASGSALDGATGEPGGETGDVAAATSRARLTEQDLATDPRLRELLRDCHELGPYLRDTADPIPILIDKLERGDADPLARAAEELGAMGARSIPALERLLAEQLQDPQRVLVLQNTVRALAFNDTRAATELLLVVLSHPESALRRQALKILAGRELAPEDFEQLRDATYFEPGTAQTSGLLAMWSADPRRTLEQMLAWMLEGRYLLDVNAAGRLLAGATDPELLERYRRLPDSVPEAFTTFTDVALMEAGDADAEARTLERLVDPEPVPRARVLTAAQAAGSVELLESFLRDDPSADLRTFAAQHLIGLLDEAGGTNAAEALVSVLDDHLRQVRWAALDALVRRQHPAAVDRALALLDGNQQELETVLPALHAAMLENPELADRARRVIVARLRTDESGANAALGHLQLVQALALCPGAESARAVLDIADAAPDDQLIEDIRAYRYLAIQLANTGVEGREVVAERLVGPNAEQDPLRRIDLLWAIGAHRDDLARTFLTEHVSRDGADPWERVFAAHLLAKVGPTEEVAPVLKAASRRFEGPWKRALECLLFHWY